MIIINIPEIHSSKSAEENVTILKAFCSELIEKINFEFEQYETIIQKLEKEISEVKKGDR